MKFYDDMSKTNKTLVNKGFMRTVPYMIRLDRFFTEEERESNLTFARSHTKDEWSKHCDDIREKIAAENIKLMEYLEKYFSFGQYKKPYNDDYTFWFWCNDLYNTTNKKLSGRDYSYITLTLKKENYEENERIFAKVKELIKDYPAQNIQAIFQYSQVEIKENVEKEAEKVFNESKGKFITLHSCVGKLDKRDGKYIFKKKNAKKYFYWIEPIDVCMIKIRHT